MTNPNAFDWPLHEREQLLLDCARDPRVPIQSLKDVAFAVLEEFRPSGIVTPAVDLAYRLTGATRPPP